MDFEFDFDPEKIAQETNDQQKKKAVLGLVGGIGDVLASGQSVGNYYLGRMNPESHAVSKMTDKFAAGMQDPMERQAKLFGAYKQAKEAKEMKSKESYLDALRDENSPTAKAFKATLINAGMPADVIKDASAFDLHSQGYSPAKMAEIKAQSAIDLGNKQSLQDRQFGQQKELQDKLFRQQKELEGLRNAGKANPAKQAYEQLPKEAQDEINELAKKNAGKRSISNQLLANLKTLDDGNLSEDQKLVAARGIIKVLNSAEGQDAVGAEEAKRLASFLEFRFFNVTEPGPIFGRAPLADFRQQIQSKADELGEAVKMNESRIDELYGRRAPKQQEQRKYVQRNEKPGVISEAMSAMVPSATAKKPMFTPHDLNNLSDDDLAKLHKQVTGN